MRIGTKMFFAAVCLVFIGIASYEVSAQRTENGKGRIVLTKDARKNGYKIHKSGDKIFVQAENVRDELDDALEGLKKLILMCKPEDPEVEMNIRFERGRTKRFLSGCMAEDLDGEALALIVVSK